MDRKKLLIVMGRSGAGKDTVAQILKSEGAKELKSYSTRPQRTPDEDTHIFINDGQCGDYPDKAAIVVINGYTYFSTKAQLMESDFYVLDPEGLKSLAEICSDMDLDITVMYIWAPYGTRCSRALQRGNKSMELDRFMTRNDSEDRMFTEFETMMYRCPYPVITIANYGDLCVLEEYVKTVYATFINK